MLVIHLVIWVKSQKKKRLQDKTLLKVYNQLLNYLKIKKTDRSFLVAAWVGARELQRSSDGGEHNQGENSANRKAIHRWQRLVTQWDTKPPNIDDRVTHVRQ